MAKIRLPKGWKKRVRSATLHVISLAPCTTIDMWGWAPSIISHVVLWLLASLPSGLTVVAYAPAWGEQFTAWERPAKYIIYDRESIFDCDAFRRWT